jgi:16S rRNA G527 N7-methylase RsmG
VLGINTSVFSKRAEQLNQQFDCVTLRAVDCMEDAVGAALRLIRSGGWLAVLTTQRQLSFVQESAGSAFRWLEPLPLPRSEQRLLALGSKEA